MPTNFPYDPARHAALEAALDALGPESSATILASASAMKRALDRGAAPEAVCCEISRITGISINAAQLEHLLKMMAWAAKRSSPPLNPIEQALALGGQPKGRDSPLLAAPATGNARLGRPQEEQADE